MSKKALLLIGVVLVFAAIYIMTRPENTDLPVSELPTGDLNGIDETPNEQNPGIGQMVLAGGSALYVAEQKPGSIVIVSSVVFAEPGFIMIHKSVNGSPGEIIGTGELIESTADMVEVTLESELVEGEKYFAMLHSDDGNGAYDDPEKDAPIIDSLGNIVMMEFSVSVDAEDPPAVAF